MNDKDKVSIFTIAIGRGAVGTTDWNILVMSTVVWTPASVTAAENVSLWSGTGYIVKPDPSSSCTVSVSQCHSKPVKMRKNNLRRAENQHRRA